MLKWTVQGTFLGLINFRLALTAAGSSSKLPASCFAAALGGVAGLAAAASGAAAAAATLARALADTPGLPFLPAAPLASRGDRPAPGSASSSGSCAISVPKVNTLSLSPKLQLMDLKGSRWLSTTCSSKMDARLLESMPAATNAYTHAARCQLLRRYN